MAILPPLAPLEAAAGYQQGDHLGPAIFSLAIQYGSCGIEVDRIISRISFFFQVKLKTLRAFLKRHDSSFSTTPIYTKSFMPLVILGVGETQGTWAFLNEFVRLPTTSSFFLEIIFYHKMY